MFSHLRGFWGFGGARTTGIAGVRSSAGIAWIGGGAGITGAGGCTRITGVARIGGRRGFGGGRMIAAAAGAGPEQG